MFNVMLLTLFILWLLSCGLSAAAGYFAGSRPRVQRSVRFPSESAESGADSRARREEANFLSYDGTPQPPIE